jgi:hypothetical protein
MSNSTVITSVPTPDACRSVKELDQMAWGVWDQKNRVADAQSSARHLIQVRWLCIALLLSIAVLGAYATRFDLELRTMMTAGAAFIGYQAMRSRRYLFAAAFAGVSVLYNPAVPVFAFSGSWHLPIALASLIPFAASLLWLNSGGAASTNWLYPNRGWSRTLATKAGQ